MSFISISWRFLPLIIVLLAFFSARYQFLSFVDVDILRVLPYLLACVLIAFASMFNRIRFMAPILIGIFAYHFIRERLQVPLSQNTVMSMFTGLNILFCSQLILSSILPEKGIFNRMGYLFLFVILMTDVILWFYGSSYLWTYWLAGIESQQYILFEKQYWITQALVTLHAVTFSVLLLMCFFRRSAADFALMLTWFAGILVFLDFSLLNVSSACFSALFLGLFVFYQQSNYQVTYKDALTGISGRRALDDYLSTLGRSYTIAMLDVDHFKKFNDSHGHDVGDQVLKMVAARVAQVQGGGKAFRYGGEEFTIVFNRKAADEIFVFLEAVRESIQKYEMILRSDERVKDKKSGKESRGTQVTNKTNTVSVTISIGVANSAAGFKPKDIIKHADQLLYKAKESGRNCTVRV
ncbi:MAG: diguanylate cyclase (GGDEF)-like protein [Oleiphilaceae bacterium]